MKRLALVIPILIAGLALPLAAQETMTDAERAAFRAEVRAYLLENPEVLTEAIAVLEQREQTAQADNDLKLLAENTAIIFDDPASWVGGNPEGDITLVEFMDYRCGYCKKAFEEVEELVKSDGNIRFVVKEFPILGDQSVLASRFAIAVRQLAGDDAYKLAHDALIVFRGDVTTASLERLAADLGHDPAAVTAAMNSDAVTAVIAANHDLANLLSISGTPTFVLERTMVRGYVPLEGMRQIIDGQRKG